jgi:hypothetical protein
LDEEVEGDDAELQRRSDGLEMACIDGAEERLI